MFAALPKMGIASVKQEARTNAAAAAVVAEANDQDADEDETEARQADVRTAKRCLRRQ